MITYIRRNINVIIRESLLLEHYKFLLLKIFLYCVTLYLYYVALRNEYESFKY